MNEQDVNGPLYLALDFTAGRVIRGLKELPLEILTTAIHCILPYFITLQFSFPIPGGTSQPGNLFQ